MIQEEGDDITITSHERTMTSHDRNSHRTEKLGRCGMWREGFGERGVERGMWGEGCEERGLGSGVWREGCGERDAYLLSTYCFE